MDQLLALRAFGRVVETGNFTRAAAALRMPKATVSKLVRDLEVHLGVQLLSRTTRQVAVTSEGRAYHEQSARLLKELEGLDASVAATRARPRGKLRIDVGSSVASRILVPALPAFTTRYPDITLELGVGDRDVDLVAENVDCVLRGGAMPESTLTARTVGRAAWITCATPAYLAAHGTPRHPRDLAQHRLVNYVSARTGRPLPLRFQERRRPLALDLPHAIGINESNAHYAAGLAGLGIVQTFAFLAAEAVAAGALLPILTAYAAPPYPIHVAYPTNRHVSHRLRVFLDFCVDTFAAALR